MVKVMGSHATTPGSIPGICNGTLSKKVNSLFISKEILKAEISKILSTICIWTLWSSERDKALLISEHDKALSCSEQDKVPEL